MASAWPLQHDSAHSAIPGPDTFGQSTLVDALCLSIADEVVGSFAIALCPAGVAEDGCRASGAQEACHR